VFGKRVTGNELCGNGVPGSLEMLYPDRANPLDWVVEGTAQSRGVTNAPFAAQIFGNAGIEYCEKYGASGEDMAKIAKKNHDHR
jgi:sterol carrier protein 2